MLFLLLLCLRAVLGVSVVLDGDDLFHVGFAGSPGAGEVKRRFLPLDNDIADLDGGVRLAAVVALFSHLIEINIGSVGRRWRAKGGGGGGGGERRGERGGGTYMQIARNPSVVASKRPTNTGHRAHTK